MVMNEGAPVAPGERSYQLRNLFHQFVVVVDLTRGVDARLVQVMTHEACTKMDGLIGEEVDAEPRLPHLYREVYPFDIAQPPADFSR